MGKWMIKNIKTNTEELMNELDISEIAAKILINRGISNVEEGKIFIDPKLDYMHEPRLMKDMEKGAVLIKKAISENSKLMIVGDYDVDGVISTYILYTSLIWTISCISQETNQKNLPRWHVTSLPFQTASQRLSWQGILDRSGWSGVPGCWIHWAHRLNWP